MSEEAATDTQDRTKKVREEIITLDFPVEHQGKTYTQLTMRRPTVRDMLNTERQDSQDKRKKQERTDLEKAVSAYADLCEVSPEVIEQLATCDFKQLDGLYEDFFS